MKPVSSVDGFEVIGYRVGIHGPNTFTQEGFVLIGEVYLGQLTFYVLVEDGLVFSCILVGKFILLIQKIVCNVVAWIEKVILVG